jgi:hypothetical protein
MNMLVPITRWVHHVLIATTALLIIAMIVPPV